MANQANAALHISPAGLDIIKEFEGWFATAYKDPVGVWTIGWGTTGTDATPGRTITKEQGDAFLRRDVIEAEDQVKSVVKVPLNQYQFDALVSFVYNAGIGTLMKSTLLKLLNAGQYEAASGQFIRYNRARDRKTNKYIVLPGLTKRRNEEATLFNHPADVERAVAVDDSIYDLKEPEKHDSNVVADAPPATTEGALGIMIKNSDTFKGLITTFTGFIAAISGLIQPLSNNPYAFGGVLVTFAGMAMIFYFKWRDTKQGR